MIKSTLIFFIVVLIFLSSLGFTVYRVQDPNFLTDQARKNNLYGKLKNNLDSLLPAESFKDSSLDKGDLADVITAGIDADTFYDLLGQAASAHLNWLAGRSNSLQFEYDLTAAKQRSRDKAVDRLVAKYNNLPVCDAKQIKTWSTTNGLPSCQLPEGNVRSNDVPTLLGQTTDGFFKDIPDTLSNNESSWSEQIRQQFTKARFYFTKTLRTIKFVWLLTIVFVLLFVLFYRRRSFLSLSFIFLLTGALEAAFGLIAWDWVGRIVFEALPNKLTDSAPFAQDMIIATLGVLKAALANLSIGLLVIGGIFLLLAIFVRPKPKGLAVPA